MDTSESDAISAGTQYMTSLAGNPERMHGERLVSSLRAQCLFSIDALSRHLHLMMKENGLLTRHKIKPKIDLELSPTVVPVALVPDMSRRSRREQVANLDAAVISTKSQSDSLPVYNQNYRELALAIIEELRHIIPELNKIHQERSDDLYLNRINNDDEIFLEIVNIVKKHKKTTQKIIKHKISKLWN